jgi:hypothetical protein
MMMAWKRLGAYSVQTPFRANRMYSASLIGRPRENVTVLFRKYSIYKMTIFIFI